MIGANVSRIDRSNAEVHKSPPSVVTAGSKDFVVAVNVMFTSPAGAGPV